jgi:hypothetical protein
MPDARAGEKARRARIDEMIERYRVVRERRLMRKAFRLWRQAEVEQQLARLDASPARVH